MLLFRCELQKLEFIKRATSCPCRHLMFLYIMTLPTTGLVCIYSLFFFFFFADMPHHSYGSPFSPQNKIIKIPATFYLTNTLNSFVAINIRSINKNTIKSMIRNVIMKQIQMVWNPTTGNQNRKKINFHITHWHLLVHCKKRL